MGPRDEWVGGAVTGEGSRDPHAMRKAPTLYDVAALAGVVTGQGFENASSFFASFLGFHSSV